MERVPPLLPSGSVGREVSTGSPTHTPFPADDQEMDTPRWARASWGSSENPSHRTSPSSRTTDGLVQMAKGMISQSISGSKYGPPQLSVP